MVRITAESHYLGTYRTCHIRYTVYVSALSVIVVVTVLAYVRLSRSLPVSLVCFFLVKGIDAKGLVLKVLECIGWAKYIPFHFTSTFMPILPMACSLS
jgi:hypothetical protein